MPTNQADIDATLSVLLMMHESGESPAISFIHAHADIFEILWSRRLGCYRIFRMQAGNIRARKVYSGVLTLRGVEAAKALSQ